MEGCQLIFSIIKFAKWAIQKTTSQIYRLFLGDVGDNKKYHLAN
jgi:hypothetical protein